MKEHNEKHIFNENKYYRRARSRANKRVAFFKNLISYILINALLILFWYFKSGPDNNFWPIWVITIWGAILVIKFVAVFIGDGLFRNYRDRKIEEYIEQERHIAEKRKMYNK